MLPAAKGSVMRDSMQTSPGELAVMRKVFELVREPVFVVDTHCGRIVEANPAACESVGIGRQKLIGRLWHETLRSASEMSLCDVDGRWSIAVDHLPQSVSGDESMRVPRDALTGLICRNALSSYIVSNDALSSLRQLAVLFVDLNDFKQVNDRCGHVAGDHVLKVVSQRIATSVRSSDLVVRYGGDEFLIVVQSANRRRNLPRLKRRLSRVIGLPILAAGFEIVISASIGVAEDTSGVTAMERLIAAADQAMYRAKGRSCASSTRHVDNGRAIRRTSK